MPGPRTPASFGQRLRAARERLNLNREQVAERMGNSAVTIGRWERDETRPSSTQIYRLAEVLQLPFGHILSPDDDVRAIVARAADPGEPFDPTVAEEVPAIPRHAEPNAPDDGPDTTAARVAQLNRERDTADKRRRMFRIRAMLLAGALVVVMLAAAVLTSDTDRHGTRAASDAAVDLPASGAQGDIESTRGLYSHAVDEVVTLAKNLARRRHARATRRQVAAGLLADADAAAHDGNLSRARRLLDRARHRYPYTNIKRAAAVRAHIHRIERARAARRRAHSRAADVATIAPPPAAASTQPRQTAPPAAAAPPPPPASFETGGGCEFEIC